MNRHGFRRAWNQAIRASLVLAALWALSGIPGTALAGKPNKPPKDDGDAINYRLARISLAESPRIKWDGVAFCVDKTRPNDPIWDYWHQFDTTLTDQNPDVVLEDGVETSVSGGGRLFFFTLGRIGVLPVEPDRWLVLDLTPTAADPMPYNPDGDDEFDSPDIDDVYGDPDPEDPPINTAPCIDHVKCTIALDGMFKKTATRQPLVIQVCMPAPAGGWGSAGWSLHSVEDLYILQDPDDKNVRTLSTSKPGNPDVHFFELWNYGEVVGVYSIPLSWKMRVVDPP